MSIISYRIDKKTGATYAYSSESYWDKEKKSPRTRQKYLGKLDKETNKIIPPKRTLTKKQDVPVKERLSEVEASAKVAGPALLLDKLTAELGLMALLKRCFPERYSEILCIVYFIVTKGQPLYLCDAWSSSHVQPFNSQLISQRISELLKIITEDDRQLFLSLWLKHIVEHDYLCYDITSVSSYSKLNDYIRPGYNRDGEQLPQLNLAMLFGQKSQLPAYYRRMPGSITDVSTLHTTVQNLNYLGIRGLDYILDRGFYSQSNLTELLKGHSHFTIAIPTRRRWVEKILDRHQNMCISTCFHQLNDDEIIYAATELYQWPDSKRRLYMHIFYDDNKVVDAHKKLLTALFKYKEEIESNKPVDEHKEDYEKYLIIKDTPKRGLSVKFNDEAIAEHRNKYAGFQCLLSTKIKDPIEALSIYRNKDVVENSFDDLKNTLDMSRLRVHASEAADSRNFLQFLALILICKIRHTSQSDKVLRNFSVREIMSHLESLVEISYSGRNGQLRTEATRSQKAIFKAFDLQWEQKS
jgi:transposase